eukprot:1000259_1
MSTSSVQDTISPVTTFAGSGMAASSTVTVLDDTEPGDTDWLTVIGDTDLDDIIGWSSFFSVCGGVVLFRGFDVTDRSTGGASDSVPRTITTSSKESSQAALSDLTGSDGLSLGLGRLLSSTAVS